MSDDASRTSVTVIKPWVIAVQAYEVHAPPRAQPGTVWLGRGTITAGPFRFFGVGLGLRRADGKIRVSPPGDGQERRAVIHDLSFLEALSAKLAETHRNFAGHLPHLEDLKLDELDEARERFAGRSRARRAPARDED